MYSDGSQTCLSNKGWRYACVNALMVITGWLKENQRYNQLSSLFLLLQAFIVVNKPIHLYT